MQYEELITSLKQVGKDPSRLIFEDELTGIANRRFLLSYFENKVPWDALNGHTLSLLMIDVDYFKSINDTYGHQCGDQALMLVARLLTEVAGEEGLPIRFAGDEFMILMPRASRTAALQLATRLHQRIHEESLNLEDEKAVVHMTLSIGVASAPEDAKTGKTLIQKADTALYHAKKSGRDRLANAAELELQVVSDMAALHLLEEVHSVGRGLELVQVAESLKKFGQRQSQFLLVEGADGMGKTTFLEAIRRTLVQGEVEVVEANGVQQEAFRPYYLAANILLILLSHRSDKGAAVFESLSSTQIAYLSHILPQLEEVQDVRLDEDEAAQREGLFNTLVFLIPKLIGFRPLILLLDDLHFADEATLMLLRVLILRREVPVFICGAFPGTAPARAKDQMPPLERFLAVQQDELGIKKITLKPLTPADIAIHLRGLFPQVGLPPDFEKHLAHVTQGNPLFLSEILRKLVMDQKISLVGRQWVIQPLEESDLPRSLEEIVSQQIATLDEEGRQLLARASTFGEDVSLSVLTGSSQKMEAKVLEFVDQAAALGLLRSDFQLNDETIRFLSKRVLDITYGGLQQDQKQALHEGIGTYEETLYQQGVLPSAAHLAYHFKRSANQEKARTYEELQAVSNKKVFNVQEAISYSGEQFEVHPEDIPLDPASLPQIPGVIRSLQTAVRNVRLYPPESKAVASAVLQATGAITQALSQNERLTFSHSKRALLVNGQKIDAGDFRFVADAFLDSLSRLELQGIAFHRGVTEQEVKLLIEAFGFARPETIDQRYWARFSSERGLIHVNLKQVRYTERTRRRGISHQLQAADQKVEHGDLAQIQDIIRCLLIAVKNIKLYPINSKTASTAVEQLLEALRKLLSRRPVLTLARASKALLVDGERVDPSDFKALAEGFLEFLDSIQLHSLTFLEHTSYFELETFIGALRQLPASGLGREFWKRFAKEQGLSGILFDERLYEVGVAGTMKESGKWEGEEEGEDTATLDGSDGSQGELSEARWAEQVAKEPFDLLLETMPGRVNEFLLQGRPKLIEPMLGRLFKDFQGRDPLLREKVLAAWRNLLKSVPSGFQGDLTKVMAEPLLLAFADERDPRMLEELAAMVYRMAANLIQFSDYQLACRLLSQLHSRHRKLEEAKDSRAPTLARILEKKLEPAVQKLLVEDLKSGDPTRQQHATQALGSLGLTTMPVLIDLIKQVEEFRVRQIAASLLADQGPMAAKTLKRELVLEISATERVRILEVIDSVTRSLKTELVFALGDKNPQVRKAGFRLAERLNDKEVVELLLEYAGHPETGLAIGAIKGLGKLKPPGAAERLASLLKPTNETDRAVAFCQALGQIGDPGSFAPLARVLAPKRFLSRRPEWNGEVRAAAVLALRQIPHPRVVDVLAPLADDPDPRIRQIARSYAKG